MNSLKITDISKFMNLLFSQETFDSLFVTDALVETFVSFRVDGYTVKDFLDDSEVYEPYVRWSRLKPIARELIKGKKTPVSMKFTFLIPEDSLVPLYSSLSLSVCKGIKYLLNIRFEKNELHIISASSSDSFLPDKSYERDWDTALEALLKRLAVNFDKEI